MWIAAAYLPKDIYTAVRPEVARVAQESISEKILTWGANAESQQPYVKTHNVWGARHDADKLITSEGWKELRAWGARNG